MHLKIQKFRNVKGFSEQVKVFSENPRIFLKAFLKNAFKGYILYRPNLKLPYYKAFLNTG